MVDKIYDIKNQIIRKFDASISKNGIERMDVGEGGMLADMIKDLAQAEKDCMEAEYYRTVIEAMNSGGSGYQSGYGGAAPYSGPSQGSGAGYDPGRSGWQNQYGSGRTRRGYDSMPSGHQDALESMRMAMQGMSQDEKERMRNEIMSM